MVKNCDVFFSYSAESDADKWVPRLAEKLKAIYKKKHGQDLSVYVYQGSPDQPRPNEDIRQQIQTALGSACFIPVVNKKYFASPNCFLEWRDYKNHETGRLGALRGQTFAAEPLISSATRLILPVWRGGGRFDRERARRQFSEAWEKPTTGVDSVFGPIKTLQDAEGKDWFDDLMTTEVVDFGEFSDPGLGAAFDDNASLVALVERLADKLHPLVQATRAFSSVELPLGVVSKIDQLLGLCTFGLRLDRFHVGGWGFTLGRGFERDFDGEFLKHGRHEVALLVTRALKSFLPQNLYKGEVNQSLLAFSKLADSRRTPLAVKDRKDEIAALIAAICFDPALRGRLGGEGGDWRHRIRKQVEQDPFTLRWVVDAKDGKGGDGDEVIFFDFITRILGEWNNAESEVGGDLRDANTGREEELFKTLLLSRKADALNALKKWISDRTVLFSECDQQEFNGNRFGTQHFITRTVGSRRYSISYDQAISELLLLRISASLSDGAGAIADANRLTARRGVQARFDPLLSALSAWIESTRQSPAPARVQGQILGFLTLSLLVVDDIVHHIASDALGAVRKLLLDHWCTLISREDCVKSLLAADCVAWASIVLLFERFMSRAKSAQMPINRMNELWKAAGEIRTERSTVIKNVLSHRNGGVKPELIVRLYSDWEKGLRGKFPEIFCGCDEQLFSIMGVFGGFDAQLENGFEPEHLLSPVGRLEVDSLGTIVRANESFNSIYMQPFARISGIGITSVERLIQEFGDQDNDFIKVLGDTVVDACAPLDGRAQRQTTSFAELSERVQAEIYRVRDKASDGYGLKDVIVLKGAREQDEPKIIIRICSSVRQDSHTQDVSAATFMTVWSFIDVTSDVQDLWPIVEKLVSSRRSA